MTWTGWLYTQIGSIYWIIALLTTAHLPDRHDADAKVIRGLWWPIYWVCQAVRHYRKARQ